jgi:formylglycine-generating enzyme required for sulfatase activity
MMGSPDNEKDREPNEGPQHKVTIARRFAVSIYDVTFDDWEACVNVGSCPREGGANDNSWERATGRSSM